MAFQILADSSRASLQDFFGILNYYNGRGESEQQRKIVSLDCSIQLHDIKNTINKTHWNVSLL